jgi:hypothetical protein
MTIIFYLFKFVRKITQFCTNLFLLHIKIDKEYMNLEGLGLKKYVK